MRRQSSFAFVVASALCLGLLCGCGGKKSRKSDRTDDSNTDRKSPEFVHKTSPPTRSKSTTPYQPPLVAKKTDNGERLFGPGGTASGKNEPQQVVRPSDNRPTHDDARLARLGIHKYESKRLRLYTDLDPKIARTLPPILDQAYDAWVKYFGKLPPTRERTEFQVTGYLIKDKALFARARLVPVDLPRFLNGRHRGYEFWMYDSQWEYYRRHLLIHEATHCFMYAVRDTRFPTWYMEGMAEFFGTHTLDANGKATFGVMPQDVKDFIGSSRIEYVQQACSAGRALGIDHVLSLRPEDYLKNPSYAWSWALCKFFDSHPRYQKGFRELAKITEASYFVMEFHKFKQAASPQIYSEWHLFANGLEYGYDPVLAAIDIRPGVPLSKVGDEKTVDVQSRAGWQSTGVWVDVNDTVELSATGQFELAQKPKPWISGPQGISFTYHQKRPLGELLYVILPDSRKSLPITALDLPYGPAGRQRRVRSTMKGTIYVRINDSNAWLADNKGTLKVTVRKVKGVSAD